MSGDYVCMFCRQARSCENCRRLVAIGIIVDCAVRLADVGGQAFCDDTLDALAELLIQHAATRRRHQKELRDESLDAQRGARDAYQEGRADAFSDR